METRTGRKVRKMAEIIHDGHYEETKIYKRPPNTYTCDSCGKNMGTDRGILFGFMGQKDTDHGEHDIGEQVNLCSMSCFINFPKSEAFKKFKRQADWCDSTPHFYLSDFDLNDLVKTPPQSKEL